MAPIGKIVGVFLEESHYKYILHGEDNHVYQMPVEKQEHMRVIERKGDIIGRYIMWKGEEFWFLD